MKEMIKESIALLLIFLFLALAFIGLPVSAKNPIFITYSQANCNLTKYIFMNAEADHLARKNFNRYCTDKTVNEIIKKEKFQKDVDLLAHLIWNEVGILGESAMYYCGSVVLNRIASDIYPDTLQEVIYQPGQYEVTWNGTLLRNPSKNAYKIAKDLLLTGSVLPHNVVFQAEFEQGSGVHIKIGNTYFCYL